MTSETVAAMSAEPLLMMRGITMEFPGVRALDRVDFAVRAGEIHCLMGENGAGKSTLIRVLSGVYRRSAGEILLEGQPISPASPKEAQQIGVSTVFQEVNLIPRLSASENMFLGRLSWRGGFLRRRQMNERARQVLRRLNLDIDVTRPICDYSMAIQQMVAIARALDISAKVLVLDEPTSSLDASEVESLFRVMRQLRDDGLGIVFITHFMDQVYEVSDRITVLRNGRLVGTYETSKLPRLDLVSHMIGRDARELQHEATAQHAGGEALGLPLLEARAVCRKGSVEGCSMAVHAGRVVGLAGLLGSGRTETLKVLFGIDRPDQGEIRVAGKPAPIPSPRRAVQLGMGYCSENRRDEGILPDLSIRENIMLVVQAKRGWWNRLSRARQREMAAHYVKFLKIATTDIEKPIGQLSGGNQQKVLLARWLAAEPRILLLDEPTRGIDVGARFEIGRLIESLRQRGMGVVLVSAEMDELARSCQEVLVLRDRRCVARLGAGDISVRAIMDAIAGEDAA